MKGFCRTRDVKHTTSKPPLLDTIMAQEREREGSRERGGERERGRERERAGERERERGREREREREKTLHKERQFILFVCKTLPASGIDGCGDRGMKSQLAPITTICVEIQTSALNVEQRERDCSSRFPSRK
jgi:hypothetical protein